MIFGEFGTNEAVGVLLAQPVVVGVRKLKKGYALQASDLTDLVSAGIGTVWGARLQVGDIGEDVAAAEIASLLSGPNTVVHRSFTGRCNVHARIAGLAQIDPSSIDRINLLHESVTVATVQPGRVVSSGDIVATVKIIPFAVSQNTLQRVSAIISQLKQPSVAGFVSRRVALLIGERAGEGERLRKMTIDSTRDRLEKLGSRLALVLRGGHSKLSIEAMIHQALTAGCELILIVGASATKDRRDVVPQAIEAAGGIIDRLGMPVDPGNMLVLAHIGEIPIINFAGCARSPHLNGFDWVLERTLANIEVSSADIARMGVGGVLKNADSEVPETSVIACTNIDRARPRIGALILAAGRSSRMGPRNKLLIPVAGIPLLLRVTNAAKASLVTSVTVVTGHEARLVKELLASCEVSLVHNPDYRLGLSSSLRVGINALPEDLDGVIVLLGDMPQITAAHIDRLVAQFVQNQTAIFVPEWDGQRGNPIIWPRCFFDEMGRLRGDEGARSILQKFHDKVVSVSMNDDAVVTDIDTPEELLRLSAA
jgi:molybdenum cofactor cytidylyltransferase